MTFVVITGESYRIDRLPSNAIEVIDCLGEHRRHVVLRRNDMPDAVGVAPEHVNRWLYDRLVEAAKAGDIIPYSDLAPTLKLNFDSPADRNKIGNLLGEISRYEVSQGRPMLSSLVWHKDLSGPGVGLRNLGIELGLVRGDEDDLTFATRQVKATFEFWSTVR